MPVITKEKIQEYVETGGIYCPYCGGERVTTDGPVSVSVGEAFQDCRCFDCGKYWKDQYKLVGVIVDSEDTEEEGVAHG